MASQPPNIIIALDYPTAKQALQFVKQLDSTLCRLKVGKELFTREGPALIEQLQNLGFDIFLDLKFHDIPNTVAGACRAAAELGVWMLNVHSLGGTKMMQAAREALDKVPGRKPLLIGVTVLTSASQADLKEMGIERTIDDQVLHLANLTHQAGLDGVVCSAREAALLRQHFGKDFCLVTPGIRPTGAKMQDQTRTLTPEAAIKAGADYLVIGRPITQAKDPLKALEAIIHF